MASAVVGALKVILSADTAEYKTAMQQASKQASEFSREFGAIGRQMTNVGSALTKTITLPILGIGAAAMKTATDLNSSLANTSALLTDVAGAELDSVVDSMKSKVQGLAVDLGKSTSDVSSGLYDVVSTLGLTNDTFGQLEIAAKAGAAGLATTQESFGFLAAVTKTYGDTSAAAFKKVGDLGFQAVNLGKTTFPELAASIGGVAPIAQVAGVSLEEMFATIATATGVTGNTSEVVTQMASAITGLLSPTKELKQMYAALGVQSGEALIAQRGFAGSLQTVAEYARQTGIAIIDLLGRKEGFILTASLAGEQATKYADNLVKMGDAARANGGVVEAAFERQTQGVNKAGFAWQQFKAELEVAAQRIGDVVLPVVLRIAESLKPLGALVKQAIEAFSALPQSVQTGTVVIAGLAAAIGPLIWALGTIVTSIGTVIGAFTAKGIATKALTALMSSSSVAAGVLRTALMGLGSAAAVAGTAFLSWNFGKWIGEVTGLTDVVGYLIAKMGDFFGLLPDGAAAQYTASRRAAEAAAAAKKQADAIDDAAVATRDLAAASAFVGPILDRNANGFDDNAEAADEAAKKAKAFADELKKLGGRDALAGAQEVVKQLGAMGGPLNVMPSQLGQMAEKLREGAQAALLMGKADLANQYTKLADTLNPIILFQQRYNVTIGEYITQTPTAVALTEDLNEQLHRLGGTVQTIGPDLENKMTLPWATFAATVYEHKPKMERSFTAIGDAVKNLGNTIISAVQGGGNVLASIGSTFGKAIGEDLAENLGGFLRRHLGKTLGDAIGSFLPGIGALLGPAISAIGGGLKKLFGIGVNDEVKKANREIETLRQQLLDTHGPLDVLEAKANAVGLSFVQAWGHQGKQGLAEFQRLIDQFNAAWDDADRRRQELEAEIETTRGSLDDLIGRARDMGYVFNEQGEFVSVDFQTLRQRADEFGVSIEGLGPAIRQQAITEEAQRIIDGFTLMSKAAGPEGTGGILVGLKDEIGALVGRSIAMGTTIPANMQPWIQELIRTDQLVDENGVAITDLSKIQFGQPVATEFDKISSALLEVVQKLDDLLSRIAAIPDHRTFTVEAQYVDHGPPPGFGDPGDHRPGDEDRPGYATGTMGRLGQWFGNFGSGVRTALHGIEAVVTPDQAPAFAMDTLAGMGLAGAGGGVVDLGALTTEMRGLRADLARRDRLMPTLINLQAKNVPGRRRR